MTLDAYLRATFKSAEICRASIPDGLRQKVQERVLRELPRLGSAGGSLAFAAGQHWRGMGGSLRDAPPPPRLGQLPELSGAEATIRQPGGAEMPSGVEEASGGDALPEAEAQAEPAAPEAGPAYAVGFRHGLTAAALSDLAVRPLQSALVDPYLRPDPEDRPARATAYDWGMAAGRQCLANQGATAILGRAGVRGTTGALGCVLGSLAYLGSKAVFRKCLEAEENEEDVAPPASIIYDEKCSVCLEDLSPGLIVILVHGSSGHACVCTDCFPQPGVRAALRACPLCRQSVSGYLSA